jgi:hypothetical protein
MMRHRTLSRGFVLVASVLEGIAALGDWQGVYMVG